MCSRAFTMAQSCLWSIRRRTSSARWADTWLGLDVGSDISLANAMAREIIHSGLANTKFIQHATSGFEAYSAREKFTLERAECETGVPAAAISRWHMHTPAPAAHNSAGRLESLSITTRWTTWWPSSTWRLLTGHVGRYGSGSESPARTEQCPGRRRHGRHSRSPDRLPACRK